MTDRAKIYSAIQKFIEMWTGKHIPHNTLKEKTHVVTDLGLDSIGVLHLVINLEETFNIKINNQDLSDSKILFIKNLAKIVEGKINENN